MKRLRYVLLIMALTPAASVSYGAIRPPVYRPINLTPSPQVIKNTDDHLADYIYHVPFDEKMFNLAYQTFLANANVEDAYLVASVAVKHNPDNLSWRERLAQSALWTGRSDIALTQWIYLYQTQHTQVAYNNVMKIALALRYDDVLIKMLKEKLEKNPQDHAAWLELGKTQDDIGDPKTAITTLNKLILTNPSKENLLALAKVYRNVGDYNNFIDVLNRVQRQYGYDSGITVQIAEIYYNRGDINKALKTLNIARQNLMTPSPEFWLTVGDLAWTSNQQYLSTLAYTRLARSNKGDYERLRRLISLIIINQPQQAYSFSLFGWHRYQQEQFFSLAIDLAIQGRNWNDAVALFQALTPRQTRLVSKRADYWTAKAGLYSGLGQPDASLSLLRQAILRYPKMSILKESYLWALVRQADREAIKYTLFYWEPLLYSYNNPMLWLPYAHAFMLLDQPNTALWLYYQHPKQLASNPEFIIYTAEAQEAAKLYDQAYRTRIYALNRYLRDYQREGEDIEVMRGIGQLSPYFYSGDEQYLLLTSLAALYRSTTDGDTLLTWATTKKNIGYMSATTQTTVNIGLVEYLKAYYFRYDFPNWAELNLAIIKNDQLSLQRLLKHPDRLPRVDRVTAAERLQYYPLAQNMAYEALTEKPDNSDYYEQFTSVMLDSDNNVGFAQEYEKFGPLLGFRSRLVGEYYSTPRWSIQPVANRWWVRSTDEQQIVNVPHYDQEFGTIVNERIHHGLLSTRVSVRQALNTFPTVSFMMENQLSHDFSTEIKLGYNQPDLDTSFMLAGGVQHQLIGLVNYSPTPRDLFSTLVEGDGYYSQDSHYLGDGYNIEENYSHKFWFSYPDYTAGAYVQYHGFDRNGSFGGSVVRLFPNTLSLEDRLDPELVARQNQSNYSNLIPDSFTEGGVVFKFGDKIRTDYTHAWRPYAAVTLFYSTLIGPANLLEGGLAGSVFGRDNLIFYVNRGTNQGTVSQINYLVGIRYRIYF